MVRCLDTYALVEISNGNPRFSHLLNEKVVIREITLAEFYGILYKRLGLMTADNWQKRLAFFTKPVPIDVLVRAVRMRIDEHKTRLSFFDCVGYQYAQANNMTFVTGDLEFQDMQGVEFIKKE